MIPLLAEGCSLDETMPPPGCDDGRSTVIIAQSVPTAAFVPCLDLGGSGWRTTRVHVDEDGTRMRVALGLDGRTTAEVAFTASCDGADGTPAPGPADGITGSALDDLGRRFVFDGGCVVVRFDGDEGRDAAARLISSVVLVERERLAAEIRRTFVDEAL